MASRGKTETEILEKNLYSQLDRLIDQLKDIEESKDEMSEEEYNEQKQETLEQLKELNASVGKFKEGNLSLVDQMNAIQLAIQAAVSNAFQTPDVIQMFAKKEKPQLRQRLADLDERLKLGQVADVKSALRQKLEILFALQKLGEKLTVDENEFLLSNSNTNMKEFEIASTNINMPSEESRDVIDDLVETVVKHEPIKTYNSQSLTALSFKKEKSEEKRSRIKSIDDSLVINMVHSELEEDDDDDERTKTDVTVKRNSKNSYQDSDISSSSQSENLSSSLILPVKQQTDEFNLVLSRNEAKNNDFLNVLKYELKEKDLDIVQLQKEINELQLENRMLKAKIPLYSTQFDLVKDESAKTMDKNNPYIKEMLVFKREKEVAMEELMKAQDTISRLTLEKNCKGIDTFDPNSPELLKKKLKTFERQIKELEAENEKYSTELTKCEKNLALVRQENAEIKIKIGENKILHEREQGLLIDIADLKNELKKLKQANGQLLEVNKRLVDELNFRPESALAHQEDGITSTQILVQHTEGAKAKNSQNNNSIDDDLNSTYCVQQNSDLKRVSRNDNYQTRSGYGTNQPNYNLSRIDDNIINNFRPFSHSSFHSKPAHASVSPKKHRPQRPVDYEYDNHYNQTKNIDSYQTSDRVSQSYSRYEEQHDYFKPDSIDSLGSNKKREIRSKSLRQYSSNETEEDDYEDKKKKSLKINVMRDIKSAQKLKLKRHEATRAKNYDQEIRDNRRYEDQNRREVGLRRSMTFNSNSKSSKSVYEIESDLNSTPSSSQTNLYNPRYQDDENEYINRGYPNRSKSVDRVTAMERKFIDFRDDEINQRELMAKKRPFVPSKPDDIHIGDVIKFSRPGGKISKGMVKYIGPLPDRSDVYFGLELDTEEGKHDGVYNDKRYFQARPNKGVFVSFSKVVMAWG